MKVSPGNSFQVKWADYIVKVTSESIIIIIIYYFIVEPTTLGHAIILTVCFFIPAMIW